MTSAKGDEEGILIFAPFGRDAQLICRALSENGFACTPCADAEAFREGLMAGAGAALLTEEALSTATVGVLTEILAAQPPWSDLPLVLLVGAQPLRPPELDAFGPRQNVTVLERPLPTVTLLTVLRSALRARRRQYQVRDLLAQLTYQAQHDALTDLPNRALFNDRLELAVASAARHEHLLAVLFIDLDDFKLVNDTLGHAAGDVMLKEVARRLQSSLRSSDTAARLGGDEFLALATGLRDPRDASRLVHKLLARLAKPYDLGERLVEIGASIGVSLYPQDALDAATLQRHADVALYRAKQGSKNEVRFFAPEMNAAVRERLELATQFSGALERSELKLHYQPQWSSRTGEALSLEALLRWTSPTLGDVSPSRFIPVAEDGGLIIAIGAWVLDESCRQVARWSSLRGEAVRVAVNVSPVQLAQENFTPLVAAVLSRHDLKPQQLELELTERMVVRDVETARRKMTELRALGVRLSIDDFGTGNASLNHLLRLPLDSLKVDQAFVQDLDRLPSTGRVVEAIVALAHALGISVVAEGVETEAQREYLSALGCERLQGFLFGRPSDARELERLLFLGE
jgi:diguanylate cyclase